MGSSKRLRHAGCVISVAWFVGTAAAQPAPDVAPPGPAPAETGSGSDATPTTEQASPPVEVAPAPLPPPPPVQPTQPVLPPAMVRLERFGIPLPDRPLVLPAGATELEISYEFRTYVVKVVDAMGTVVYRRTGFADDRTADFRVAHAFGPFEVSAGLGELARLEIKYDTNAAPGEVFVGSNFSFVEKNGSYHHNQYAGARHKILLMPGRLSVVAGASVSLYEELVHIDSMPVEGELVTTNAGATAYVQVWEPFAISAGLSAAARLWESAAFGGYKTSLGTGLYTYLGFYKWDFYVGGNLFNVTRGQPTTFFTFGFMKRWGL